MCYFDIPRQRVRIDSETVILRGDRHFTAAQVFHRLIRAAMSKFQLEGRSAQGEAKDLMAETNPEDRTFAHQVADRLVRIRERGWITRAVRKKNSIWVECKHFVRGCRCGDNRDAEAFLPQEAQDIFFNAIVICHDTKPDRRKRAFGPAILSCD